MKNDFVLVMKVKGLTHNQAAELGAKSTVAAKRIAPDRRNILCIMKSEKK